MTAQGLRKGKSGSINSCTLALFGAEFTHIPQVSSFLISGPIRDIFATDGLELSGGVPI